MRQFRDRREAGQSLAAALAHFAKRGDVVVLALPRGGVPVAFEVAKALAAPLDVLVVRKLGTPGHEELAMGAIASGGVRILNEDVIGALHLSQQAIAAESVRQQREIERREQAYRGGRSPLAVAGKTVIVVDDGVATGATMRAAVAVLKQHHPLRIVVAVPTAAEDTYQTLCQEADEVICLARPEPYGAVGNWYMDFSQTSDAEVQALLAQAEMGLSH